MSTQPGRDLPEPDRLDAALAVANIPSLLMVLHHLTGEEQWLADPYRPTRARGQEDHDTGGLDEDLQRQIRSAAATAIHRWYRGEPAATGSPDEYHLRRMMEACVGEPVPAEYAHMGRVEMGFDADPSSRADHPLEPPQADVSAIVIGAGVSGLAVTKRFRDAGVPFTVLERNREVGGTWFENGYPGCGVDTPSYLYSFSFARRAWNRYFARQPEVAAYMSSVADEFDLRSSIVFGAEVVRAEYDEDAAMWTVTARGPDGREIAYTATILVSAVGLFNPPKVPTLPGADEFDGAAFHSARWPAGLVLSGKRVAVVGTGASAMQIVPAISAGPTEVTVFQRTPQWIAPMEKYFDDVSGDVHWLMDHVPYYHEWYRFRLVWLWNDKVHAGLRMDPEWTGSPAAVNRVNDRNRQYLTAYIEQQLDGFPELLGKSVPQYPPFAKRMLLDNGWYRALKRPNVSLVDETVVALERDGVVTTSGARHPADVVVYATGFETDRYLHPIEVTGRGGAVLAKAWNETDPRAFLGMTVPGFPNLFLMYGPNTNPPGGSYIYIAECQSHYIASLAATMRARGIASVDCRDERYEAYTSEVDAAAAELLWSHPGVESYYKNAFGRVVTNSPWRVVDYWHMTRQPDLADYVVEHKRTTTAT
jgi:4-hydroxyacetophenone monooxygenase